MKQEDKQLLLKDLCARIPYRTFVCLNPGAYNKPETCILTGIHGEKVHLNVDSDPFRINSIKPYLRPMSSMTEEERLYFHRNSGKVQILVDEEKLITKPFYGYTIHLFDWLNAHHFDYHNLIGKGLAIEAPEGMYKL